MNNSLLWLSLLGGLLIIGAVVYTLFKFCRPVKPNVNTNVLGHVYEVAPETIVDYTANVPNGETRAIVIVEKEAFVNSDLLSKCIDKSKNCEDLYKNVFLPKQGLSADDRDVGGVLITTKHDDVLDIYTVSATRIGDNVAVSKKTYLLSAENHISDVITQFYNQFNMILPEALVILVDPPTVDTPIIHDTGVTEIPDEGVTDLTDLIGQESGEKFGMYTGALDSWLSTHSQPSVDRYTKNSTVVVKDVHSVNNAVPQELVGETIPVDSTNRFQTPQQYATEQ